MGGLVDMVFGGGGDDAADASRDAANLQAQATKEAARLQAKSQREALEYLKAREAIPQQFREGALAQLGGLYGLEGGEGSQRALINQAKRSPLYSAILGGRKAGESAIMRQSSATGGLRSGNIQHALYDYNTQLQNQALLEAYNQQLSGLQGLAQLPSNVNQIAATQAGIGQTLGQGILGAGTAQAQGITAAAQAQQAAQQSQTSNLMGLGSLGISAYSAGLFSDRTLKKDVKHIGKVKGHDWYEWEWNSVAEEDLGLKGKSQGCMADEVFETNPEAILITEEGFMAINYHKLGITDMPAQK